MRPHPSATAALLVLALLSPGAGVAGEKPAGPDLEATLLHDRALTKAHESETFPDVPANSRFAALEELGRYRRYLESLAPFTEEAMVGSQVGDVFRSDPAATIWLAHVLGPREAIFRFRRDIFPRNEPFVLRDVPTDKMVDGRPYGPPNGLPFVVSGTSRTVLGQLLVVQPRLKGRPDAATVRQAHTEAAVVNEARAAEQQEIKARVEARLATEAAAYKAEEVRLAPLRAAAEKKRREDRAAKKLRLAHEGHRLTSDTFTFRLRLSDLVKAYPDTPAAAEARKLLPRDFPRP